MPIKEKLTLGLGLVILANSAFADTYKIRSGDTVEKIAKRQGVSLKALLAANGLHRNSTLHVGSRLTIPGSSSSSTSSNRSAGSGGYVVRDGDIDWAIAKKHGITVTQLRSMNPGIRWNALKVGSRLNVPGARAASFTPTVSSSAPRSKGTYKLQSGDNDWIVAKRFGTTPKVIHQLNPSIRWCRAQVGTVIQVPGGSTSSTSTSTASASIRARYAVVAGDNVTIRRGPSRNSEAITTVDAGTRVVVLDRDGDWYKLRFPKGTNAWMRGDFLRAVKAPTTIARTNSSSKRVASKANSNAGYTTITKTGATVDRVLNNARSMQGVRYRWGAASRSATDCSGFTSQAYRSAGIKLPRTSSEQAGVGSPVARKNLRAGDLVFFQTVRGCRISHVGIYVGNGNFIHASSGGGQVMESSLSDPYYNNRYVTARRLVKPKQTRAEMVKSLSSLPKLEDFDAGVPGKLPNVSSVQAPPAKD